MPGVRNGNLTMIRKTKIVGLALSLLSFIAMVLSLKSEFGYDSISPCTVEILHGGMRITIGAAQHGAIGFFWEVCPRLAWFPWFPKFSTFTPVTMILIPLWIPLLLGLIPSFVAWRSSRRTPPHCCQQCGYNLTGNESGVCPECGTEIKP